MRKALPHPRRRRLHALRKNGSKDDGHAKEAWKHSNGGGHDDDGAVGNGVHDPESETAAGADQHFSAYMILAHLLVGPSMSQAILLVAAAQFAACRFAGVKMFCYAQYLLEAGGWAELAHCKAAMLLQGNEHLCAPGLASRVCGMCPGHGLQGMEAAEAAGLAHERDASIALLHSDADRREFISAGAAAGLAVRSRCLPAPESPPVTAVGARCAAVGQARVMAFCRACGPQGFSARMSWAQKTHVI